MTNQPRAREAVELPEGALDDALIEVLEAEVKRLRSKRAPSAPPDDAVREAVAKEIVDCCGYDPDDPAMTANFGADKLLWEVVATRLDKYVAALTHPQRGLGWGWRDIKSAPRDGSDVLLFRPHGLIKVVLANWHIPHEGSTRGWWNARDNRYYDEVPADAPTHWMPIPTPPSTQEQRDV